MPIERDNQGGSQIENEQLDHEQKENYHTYFFFYLNNINHQE